MSAQDPNQALTPTAVTLTGAGIGADLPADGEIIQPTDFAPLSGPRKRRPRGLRPVQIVTGAALLLSAAVALYLFSAKSVMIITDPADASVDVSGGFSLALGGSRLMHSGDYVLSASADGYESLQRTISVGDEQNQTIRLALAKLPGILTVESPIEDSAQVWIDGQATGTLNHPIANIPAGRHQIRIVSERYRPFTAEVTIEGKGIAQSLSVNLEPAWADVRIASEPAGAELLVDGEVLGTTPLVAEILEGERELRLRLPGHKSWQEIRDLRAGEALDLGAIELAKADGLIWVASTPAQASITINGEYHGQTPREVALAPGREYQLTLFRDGFEPAQRKVKVSSGITEQVEVALQPRLGEIKVSATPADALLYVDGRLMGRANQTLTLPASQAQITIKKDGFADYSTTILPRPSLAQSLNVRLRTVEEARWENVPTTIFSKAGQRLMLFKPNDTFTMGSSRREQGRRANEAMRKVSLSRPFYLGVHEVTNAQFRQFEREHSSSHVKGQSLDGEQFPVVNVTWQQAALYCNWLSEQENLPPFYRLEGGLVTGFDPQSTGYRLPTEAEWAWAARFENGHMLKYPWGEELPPVNNTGNFADRAAAPVAGYILHQYLDGFAVSAPVASFPPNAKGIYDLGGNVAEWINDFYDIQTSLSDKATPDPLGPETGAYHVIRGSSWVHGSVTELRLAFRDYGEEARNDVGFRVARFVDP